MNSADLPLSRLVDLRHRLHAIPEVSGEEILTAQLIAGELRSLSPDLLLTGLGGTGVAAVFNGSEAGPSVLFRAELDALPIAESDALPYHSRHAGCSHKCGHDGHMAILAGLAQHAAHRRPRRGRLIALFQPAEETGAGAASVAADERFAQIRPDYAFALHNLPGYPCGSIVAKSGNFTPAVRSVIFRLQGVTAHAAEPENGINPAGAVAEILPFAADLQQADAQRADFALLTPVHLVLGEPAYGVAAGYGEVHLTLRTWNPDAMQRLTGRLLEGVAAIAGRHRLGLQTEWTNCFEANVNDPAAAGLLRDAARKAGLPLIERDHPLKWGEDFGALTRNIPGAMFGLGAGEQTPALHHPAYDFPDAIIEPGLRLLVAAAGILLG